MNRINFYIQSLSLTSKVIFYILSLIFAGSALVLLWKVNNYFLVNIPAEGGTMTEGIIGLPRFINPVLAVTDGDKDLTTLVYSGLMRENPDGSFIPDLAQSYTISPDAKSYTFILKPAATFHDGTKVTAEDIIFTIHQIQNPDIKSPKRAQWEGIVVEKIDDLTVKFILPQPYASFLENTTLGILPKHIWSAESPEEFLLDDRNTNPIGSGPYRIKSVKKNNNLPVSYTLQAFKQFTLGEPKIGTIVFSIFSTEKALEEAYLAGTVNNINSISPKVALELKNRNETLHTAALPRVFGVFFNQSANAALADSSVRRALDVSVNRDYIIDTVLEGFGTPLKGPLPPDFLENSQSTSTGSSDEPIQIANSLLDKAGWKINADGIREKKTSNGTTTLEFSISTSDAPELKEVAEIIKAEWQKIGANVSVKVFEGGYLNQDIIRPRKYDALLFGQVVNKDSDLYAFWHSKERVDPGLNIALYANSKADKSLDNLSTSQNAEVRQLAYQTFLDEIAKDVPAVFLYSPKFIYVTSPEIRNINLKALDAQTDRFNNVYAWYINTDRVWKIFAR